MRDKVSSFSERLTDIMIEKEMSQSELARQANISASSVSDWLNNKYEAKQDKIDIIAKVLNVSPTYLMGYDVSPERVLEDRPEIITFNNLKRIPILGEIACGDPILCQENFDGYFITDPSIVSADFAIYADGDSMIDASINDGDLVFIRKTPTVENGAICAVLIEDETTLKRFYKSEDQIILQPENNKYNPIIITASDSKNVMILGEMVGVYSRRNRWEKGY